jgi:hypothetical protein
MRIFKITSAGPKPDGKDLLGLLIIQSSEGFFVVNPEPGLETPRILAESELVHITGKPPRVKFKFRHDHLNWDLDVDEALEFKMSGRWHNPHKPGEKPQEPDTWLASGTGMGVPGEEEAQAAAAKYGQ